MMRLGLFLFPSAIDNAIADIRQANDDGFTSVWCPQIFGFDTLTILAIVGREVPDIELGTAVVPTYPRHPMALAQQALTTNSACGGRLALGIGLSHQIVIENMLGYSFEKPAIHMRDYLSILVPLLNERKVSYDGPSLIGRGQLSVPPDTPAPAVLIAALAPLMLKLAGTLASGTVTWMTGPRTVESHINPTMRAAAAQAGRPVPRTVAGIPICVTADVDGARARAAKEYSMYGMLPSYRAMLDREGLTGPADFAAIGDEKSVTAHLQRLFDAGADDVIVQAFGSDEELTRSRALLTSLL